jgi:outer membrane protein assembly factor BamB
MSHPLSHQSFAAGPFARALVVVSVLGVAGGWSCGRDPTGTDIRERWFQPQAGSSWARPAVAGDLVYFGTGDGKVIARSVATGVQRWARTIDGTRIEGANFVVHDGVVAVATLRSTVALDAGTGVELWRYQAPPEMGLGATGLPGGVSLSHLAVDDQHVYVPAWGASISALDRRTGVVRWVWQPGRAPTDTAMADRFRSGSMGVRVSGDTLFASAWHFTIENGVTSEAWLLALDRRTGREIWRTTLPNPRGGTVFAAPALTDRAVVLAVSSGRVAAVDRATGQPVWAFEPPLERSPASQAETDADAVYSDGGDGFVYALDPATGAVKWKAPFPTQTSHDMVVSARHLYAPMGYYLYIFDRRTGRRIAALPQPGATAETGSLFSSPVAVAGGRVFATVHQGAWSFDEP